jgi:hypothetical protein
MWQQKLRDRHFEAGAALPGNPKTVTSAEQVDSRVKES